MRQLLEELNDSLLIENAPSATWVVCGGAALALRGLAVRPTRDVDVLGEWEHGGRCVEAISAFSSKVQRAIARVAAAHPDLRGLGARWVNLGVQRLLEFGLPSGFESRLTALHIGPRLTVHLPGRTDLVAFKIFAACDDLGRRQAVHLADLSALDPTRAEVEHAVQWIENIPDVHMGIRASLRRMLEELGHEDLAYYI